MVPTPWEFKETVPCVMFSVRQSRLAMTERLMPSFILFERLQLVLGLPTRRQFFTGCICFLWQYSKRNADVIRTQFTVLALQCLRIHLSQGSNKVPPQKYSHLKNAENFLTYKMKGEVQTL